jgi:hypothetical protein
LSRKQERIAKQSIPNSGSAFHSFILEVEKIMNIPNITGWLREIEYYIHKLMSGDNDTAFLVIEIAGTEDFIQFLKNEKGVQLDFPLITDRQKQLEERVRQEAFEQNLELLENNGTDGMPFLTIFLIPVNGTSLEVAQSIENLLINIFGVNANTMLGVAACKQERPGLQTDC